MPSLALIWLSGMTGIATASAPDQPSPPHQDIVVIADRPRGEVPGAITTENRIEAAAIQGLGASTLADILSQIAALTGSSQARSGDGPVLLVNGRRISSFDEVRNLPPEAIERVDILPEEAALRLGYPARSKPVNIVLKSAYAAISGELEDRVTTIGLRNDFNTEANLVRIRGDNRLTVDLQYQTADAITEAKRALVRPLDALAASSTGLISALQGGNLLPLAQTYAGVSTTSRTLASFANAPAADDTGAWRSLTPASQQFTANAAFARALDGGPTLSLNGKYDRLMQKDLLGPAIADLALPALAPFTVPLRLRTVLADRPVQTRATSVDTVHIGTQLAGTGRWRWAVSGNLDHIALGRDTQGGTDTTAWQQAITSGSLADPFAPPPAALIAAKSASHASSRDDTLGLDSFISGSAFALPAGNANVTLFAKITRETLTSHDSAGDHHLARTYGSAQITLDLPLLSARSPIGALDAGASLSNDSWSDAGTVQGFGANLSWKPRKSLALLVSAMRDAMPPPMTQLGAPQNLTQQATLYDFGTGRSVNAALVTGGNPALIADQRQILKVQVEWKPLKGLSLTGTYTDLVDRNPLVLFPAPSAVFEADLSNRITRDANSAISSFDARPFNATREHRQELRLAGVFSHSFGKSEGPAVPGKGGFGGGHSFGASGSMVQFSLVDTIRLNDQLTLVSGGPAYDLVQANPLGEAMRAPRHKIDAQLSATSHGWGLRAGGVWTQGGRNGGGSTGEVSFADRLAFNLRLFWFPDRNPSLLQAVPIAKGVRFLLAIDNLFGSWQLVEDRAGTTPLAYQRWALDPVGRTVRFSIRKTLD